SGSTECVNLLLSQLKSSEYKLGQEQLLTYLMQAIKENKPHMVHFFVCEIKNTMPDKGKNIFDSITMNTTSVEKTDLSIVRTLKSCGVNFSETAKRIIEIKETRPVGYVLPIGIMLSKFTDFIKEIFQCNDLSESLKKFKEFKSVAETVKPATYSELNNPDLDLNFK
ncbi:MAG: hypothetical protein HYX60_03760, partial [Legionella longbeachae]|nr:hypothetical protein [Legionella longbeachae]